MYKIMLFYRIRIIKIFWVDSYEKRKSRKMTNESQLNERFKK